MATSTNRKSRQTISSTAVATKRIKKTGFAKRTVEEGECFLRGNNYAKLSSLSITSTSNLNALSEWNNDSAVLKSLYGADLLGYSQNWLDDGNGSTFISKDSTDIPEKDKTYYPIYERKKHYIPSDKTALTTVLSDIDEAFQGMEGETLAVGLEFNGTTIAPEEALSIPLKSGDSISFLENGSSELTVSNGIFALSAALNGNNSLGDWLEAGPLVEELELDQSQTTLITADSFFKGAYQPITKTANKTIDFTTLCPSLNIDEVMAFSLDLQTSLSCGRFLSTNAVISDGNHLTSYAISGDGPKYKSNGNIDISASQNVIIANLNSLYTINEFHQSETIAITNTTTIPDKWRGDVWYNATSLLTSENANSHIRVEIVGAKAYRAIPSYTPKYIEVLPKQVLL